MCLISIRKGVVTALYCDIGVCVMLFDLVVVRWYAGWVMYSRTLSRPVTAVLGDCHAPPPEFELALGHDDQFGDEPDPE